MKIPEVDATAARKAAEELERRKAAKARRIRSRKYYSEDWFLLDLLSEWERADRLDATGELLLSQVNKSLDRDGWVAKRIRDDAVAWIEGQIGRKLPTEVSAKGWRP